MGAKDISDAIIRVACALEEIRDELRLQTTFRKKGLKELTQAMRKIDKKLKTP